MRNLKKISPQCLSCLRLFLGESYTSLQYLYRIPKQTISKIVPEVCDAIHTALKEEYLKVSVTKLESSGVTVINCYGPPSL